MTSQKRTRLIAAATVNAVLLLLILVGIMVYQLVTIFVLNKNNTDLKNQISQTNSDIEDMKNDIGYYQSEDGIIDLIIEYELSGK